MQTYLASPLGFSEAGRYAYYHLIIPALEKAGLDIIDPWHLTDGKLISEAMEMPPGIERTTRWQEINAIIGQNNRQGIEACQFMIAILDGCDLDSGTAAEVGYAAAIGKTVWGYRGDFRQCRDNEGSVVNLQVEYFIKYSGGAVVSNLEELVTQVKRFVGN
ncbi:nucleoside 2-deoxyribosyltransferase [Desulfurispira natronophila]|uniref:Nucleoside 2-deoxyribosyltransferase n=1 Tax=Desulfurispira natronophila TaxID=682562 RepID=A0A7W8DGQ2_9BACT|nr:nucleoside 2-deoxyribosyltransferase [Desulfurispira natronophila]MBB5021498.1 nucleoside 2-deoxyribosyltransferase [Desulfurispira natronophila]